MSILMLIGLVLVICMLMTTKAERAEARERLRPLGRRLMPIAVALWAWILWSLARGPPN